MLVAGSILVGCGKVALNGNRIGQSIKYDPVSIAPTSDLVSICNSITAKTAVLAGPSGPYQFGFAQKDCYDPDLPLANNLALLLNQHFQQQLKLEVPAEFTILNVPMVESSLMLKQRRQELSRLFVVHFLI